MPALIIITNRVVMGFADTAYYWAPNIIIADTGVFGSSDSQTHFEPFNQSATIPEDIYSNRYNYVNGQIVPFTYTQPEKDAFIAQLKIDIKNLEAPTWLMRGSRELELAFIVERAQEQVDDNNSLESILAAHYHYQKILTVENAIVILRNQIQEWLL